MAKIVNRPFTTHTPIVCYNGGMITKVSDIAKEFRTYMGDSAIDVPDDFIIAGLAWAYRSLPLEPKLAKVFQKHYTLDLDTKDGYAWCLNEDFANIADFLYLNFWTTGAGGDICLLDVCYQTPEVFYTENGLPELRKAGRPCKYTLERDDDDVYVVFDRPLNISCVADYMCYGFLKEPTSMKDEISLPKPVKNLIFSAMKEFYFREAEDANMAQEIGLYMDSKLVPEVVQYINQRWSSAPHVVLGEV